MSFGSYTLRGELSQCFIELIVVGFARLCLRPLCRLFLIHFGRCSLNSRCTGPRSFNDWRSSLFLLFLGLTQDDSVGPVPEQSLRTPSWPWACRLYHLLHRRLRQLPNDSVPSEGRNLDVVILRQQEVSLA